MGSRSSAQGVARGGCGLLFRVPVAWMWRRVPAIATVAIIGQAPGTRVHETGIPWNDRSGVRLRDWLQLDRDRFYDESRIAIMPMGFCYPGVDRNGGDKPPRRECAPAWHPRLTPFLGGIGLTLLVGGYAQKYYLGKRRARTMTETVRGWRTICRNSCRYRIRAGAIPPG